MQLCILRLSAIGDVCHAAAMVNAIRQQKPHIEITWIIGKVEYQLVKDMQGVEFIIYDKRGGKESLESVKTALNGRVFDYLFVMQVALRANLLSRQIKAKHRVGFDWHRSKELHWLFCNKRIAPRKNAHVLEGFMGFAEVLGVSPVTKPTWDIPISNEDRQWAESTTEPLGKYAVISPAASKAERNWSAEGYAQAADYLSKQGIEVVLCGGPGELDKSISEAIVQKTQSITLNLVGKTSLKQMLAILGNAELVIAPDTGPAHMATTQGTPVIGLYAHSNPRRTGPYLSQATTVSVYDECIKKQCGKDWRELPWGTRAKGSNLMSLISMQAVRVKIQQILHLKS